MYKTIDAEDVTNDTPTLLPTTIDTDDQTTISFMTPNNYNYIKKTDKVDDFIKSFLQNNNILSRHSQQKPNTTTSENESEEDPGNEIPDLHVRQDYDSDSEEEDDVVTSRTLQETVNNERTNVETEIKRDEYDRKRQHSDKENITSTSDFSFPSSHSTTYSSNYPSSTTIKK